jgi:FkbM family methyltransferase
VHFSRILRERIHPLNRLRRSSGGRIILNAVDLPVWVRPRGIGIPVRARLVRHASSYLLEGGAEPGVFGLFMSLASEFGFRSFWDVGANFGYYAWLACSALPDCEIRLFEPDPDNADLIRATIHRSNLTCATLREIALSDSSGTATFLLDGQTGSTGQIADATGDTFARRQWGIASRGIAVVTSTWDDERKLSAPADLVKLDVEGCEEAVIRGGWATITRDQPLLVYECYHGGAQINAALRKLGYRIFDADRAVPVAPVTCNFFALPRRYHGATTSLLEHWQALIS